MFSSLVISLIISIIGGSSSDLVLYLSYRTALISTWGSYIPSILLPIPPGAGGGRWGGEGASGCVVRSYQLGLNHDKDKGWKQWKQNDHEVQWYLSAAVEDAVLLGKPALRSTQHGTEHESEHLTARRGGEGVFSVCGP